MSLRGTTSKGGIIFVKQATELDNIHRTYILILANYIIQ